MTFVFGRDPRRHFCGLFVALGDRAVAAQLRPILVAALLLVPALADALDPCDGACLAAEGAFAALVVADAAGTAWGLRHGLAEANPILGRRPGPARLAVLAGGGAALHAGVTLLLPRHWRSIWLVESLVLEGVVVGRNAALLVQLAW